MLKCSDKFIYFTKQKTEKLRGKRKIVLADYVYLFLRVYGIKSGCETCRGDGVKRVRLSKLT